MADTVKVGLIGAGSMTLKERQSSSRAFILTMSASGNNILRPGSVSVSCAGSGFHS